MTEEKMTENTEETVKDSEVTEETSEEVKEQETAAEEDKEEKKSIFGKKKSSKLEEKIAELEDARMRQLAEFENFRKRSEKEKSQMFEIGAKSVVEKILPVIDNFERGLASMPEEEKGTPFADGVELVYKQMLGALDEIGVKPIEAVGQEFDPNFHNAVMTVESDELESGTVAEELQKGYMYQDSVVRHSMVKVVN
ncbi:MAG: nucleotide exchange factor GrpE [Lachnospiraceae bacterium]|nr:nucleotide exchange factor GrpE [Lachnospiraceae bacterium]